MILYKIKQDILISFYIIRIIYKYLIFRVVIILAVQTAITNFKLY